MKKGNGADTASFCQLKLKNLSGVERGYQAVGQAENDALHQQSECDDSQLSDSDYSSVSSYYYRMQAGGLLVCQEDQQKVGR